ncbi:hypothetical protein MSAN_02510400 [Mycena sanguinolenta]|uniref:Hydrophobin n=1 Tax=Mycena sanguinolenta TaxID=230812 RepID=A0A8H6WR36_9AGAR|nr:hypothetical protein MSAN_02510400 [Mycena sanguinolenta]
MFSKLSVVVTSVLIILTAAIRTTIPVTSDQCCASIIDSNSAEAQAILALFGIVLPSDPSVPIGLNCSESPLTVIEVGGNSW